MCHSIDLSHTPYAYREGTDENKTSLETFQESTNNAANKSTLIYFPEAYWLLQQRVPLPHFFFFFARLNNRSNVFKLLIYRLQPVVSFPRGRGELRDSGPSGCEGDYLPRCITEQLNSSVSNTTMESIGNNAIFLYHVTQRLRDSYSRIRIDALKVSVISAKADVLGTPWMVLCSNQGHPTTGCFQIRHK